MIVELMASGTIINIKGGDVGIKLSTGKVIATKKDMIGFSVSIGNTIYTNNNKFFIAGENTSAKEQHHE